MADGADRGRGNGAEKRQALKQGALVRGMFLRFRTNGSGLRFRAGPADCAEREGDGKRIHRESHAHESCFQNIHNATSLKPGPDLFFSSKNDCLSEKKTKKMVRPRGLEPRTQ